MSAALPPPRPLGRVLRGAEWDLYADAQGALTAARADAERFRQDEAALSRAAAERLLDETRAAAEADATKLLAETSAMIQRQLASARLAVAEAIAVGVARVIGEMDVADAVARAAVVAIKNLHERNGITVLVAPDSLERVRGHLHGLAVTVAGDGALAAGDCVVQTEAGFVQAGLGTQIEVLRNALRAEAAG